MKQEIKERIEKIKKGIVPEGYKKTTFGILPIDWNLFTLEKISIELVRGPFGSTLKKEHLVKNGYKVYEQKNAIYKNFTYGNYFVNKEKYDKLKRFSVAEGDYIVSCSGTIGKIYQIPSNAPKGIINQALLKIRLNEKIVNSDFFYQYFQLSRFQKQIVDNTQGGAMQNLVGMKIFRRTKLYLPTFREQNKIANILSTWDNAIELKEKLIEQKKKQKKGLMQLLLTGKKRFGRFKEAWKPYKISNFLKESNKRVNDNECIVASIGKFGLRHRDEVYDKELTKNYENYKLLPQNHIAYGLGSQSIDFGINLSDYDYCVSPAYKVFLIKNINGIFLYELLRVINPLYSFKYMITSARQGKSVDFIGYLNESIFVPNIEEQNAIANVLSTADKEIELLEKQLEELKKQKKGLMQLLLTGIVRVTD